LKNETFIWEKLESFARKEVVPFKKTKLDRYTLLENDLDITGDDSDEFMEEFFKSFNVDPGDFDLGRYFEGEGVSIFAIFYPLILVGLLLYRLCGGKLKGSDKIPLTLGMLEKAIELGKWDTAEIENYFKKEQQKYLEKKV
jgi:hypothetical protein